ncbi:MAG TPA: leucine/isoleucine/valine transporter permease subunit [Acidimicrobiia bacterium]
MTAATVDAAAPRTARFDVRRLLRYGGLAGLAMVFVAATGMLETFNNRLLIRPILSMGYLILLSAPFVMGYLVGKRTEIEGVETAPRTSADVVLAIVAGLIAGLITALFAALVDTFPGLRGTFPRMGPQMVSLLTFDRGVGIGFLILPAVAAVLGALGVAMHWLSDRLRKALGVGALTVVSTAIFESVVKDVFDWFSTLPRFLYHTAGGLSVVSAIVLFVVAAGASFFLQGRKVPGLGSLTSADTGERRRSSLIAAAVVLVLTIVLPQLLGGVLNELLTNVGLFLLMGLGLNIVVGYAGLLDLGYVAFFAVGAYTMALLTSPLSAVPFQLNWWQAFPIVLLMAALAGVFVGTPVIRMRGDYLAIVTLGFGEIVRYLFLSDWLSPFFGGAQGVRRIPGIPVGSNEIGGSDITQFVYFTLFFVAIAAYISWRLQDSRIGRAWAAMREDEDIAEAVGIDTVKAKLLAFVTGAVLASFAGALFAAKVGTVFAHSFEIIVSIIILVVVIVGGMGNIAGVAVGALVLIGVLGGPNQPGLLQEFGEYKLLVYGALLIFMMLQKPEGLLPSARRARELHQEEYLQDAWLDKEGRFVGQEQEA